MDGEELLDSQNNVPKTNVKSRSSLRWPVLWMCSFVMFCSYYCYDNVSALFDQFKDAKNTGLSSTQVNALYSAYSCPNVVLPFFGGYIVDRYGVRRTLILFAFLLVVGQTVFALGSSMGGTGGFGVMIFGRFIYGLGGESLCVCAQTLLAEWFMGKEMALAMGINLSVSRAGSAVNDKTSIALYKGSSLPFVLWFGVMLLGTGFAAALCTAWLDKKVMEAEKPSATDAPDRVSVSQALKKSFASQSQSSFNDPTRRSVKGTSFVANMDQPEKLDADLPSISFKELTAELWTSFLSFKLCFWILCIGCIVVYATVLPFNNILSTFMSAKYYPDYISKYYYNDHGDCTEYADHKHSDLKDDASDYASVYLMIPFGISAGLSPFLGAFVDRLGMRTTLMLVSAAVLTCVHLFFGLAKGVDFTGKFAADTDSAIDVPWYRHPTVGVVFLGIAYSFYAAAIWPAVVYVVEEHQVGTAYGLITALQNFGLFLVPLVVGAVTESNPPCNPSKDTGGFLYAEWIFVAFGAFGVLIGIYLHLIPEGRRLNLKDPWQGLEPQHLPDEDSNPLSPVNSDVPAPKKAKQDDPAGDDDYASMA